MIYRKNLKLTMMDVKVKTSETLVSLRKRKLIDVVLSVKFPTGVKYLNNREGTIVCDVKKVKIKSLR